MMKTLSSSKKLQKSPAAAHEITPKFRDGIEEIRSYFFARDPKRWPVFCNPSFAEIIAFREKLLPTKKRLAAYPDGEKLLKQLRSESVVSALGEDPRSNADQLLRFVAAMSKNWEDPASVENVITSSSDAAIFGSMTGILANPNLVHPEYSEMAHELEENVVRQMASLAGYDPARATGIFTQGGTFCNLYGYLLGI